MRRNSRRDGQYRPFEAHRWAVERRARRRQRRVDKNPTLRDLIAELLAQRWSPQIARAPTTRLPRGTIDVVVPRKHLSGCVPTPFALDPTTTVRSPHRGWLRTGRTHRRAHQRPGQRRPRFAQPMLSIHQRPFAPADRSQPGHWEGGLIVGKNQRSAIGTFVERQTRPIRLMHLPLPSEVVCRCGVTVGPAADECQRGNAKLSSSAGRSFAPDAEKTLECRLTGGNCRTSQTPVIRTGLPRHAAPHPDIDYTVRLKFGSIP
ncbi:transposase [Mycobacterium avium]|uniref:transposase n=1 Tax=Mycobacterium avium TaxID=1764 RepID=UPI00373FCA50